MTVEDALLELITLITDSASALQWAQQDNVDRDTAYQHISGALEQRREAMEGVYSRIQNFLELSFEAYESDWWSLIFETSKEFVESRAMQNEVNKTLVEKEEARAENER